MTTEAPLLPLDAGEQYRFAFSMNACIGCHSCEVACGEQNGLPGGTAWRRVGEVEGGAFPDTKRFHLSMACNHCIEPACLEGCPTNAYVKLDNGVVQHHADDCIGCQYCTWNCPYSVPVFQTDRRVVSKCDMCLPRLSEGMLPACVDACPTRAISVEKVDIETWRRDHTAGDAPRVPSAGLTISTTRIELPDDVPADTWAGSDWRLRPEDPHTPLIALTILTQVAVGVSLTASTASGRTLAAVLAVVALGASLLHLGRPVMAWKALRNLRRSWLSREVALFGAYAGAAVAAAGLPGVPGAHWLAAGIGVAGVYASARLYMVPGRPAWNTRLTVAHFGATALATGPLLTGHPWLAVAAVVVQVVVLAANLLRLHLDGRPEWRGTVRLIRRDYRPLLGIRVGAAVLGVVFAVTGGPVAALVAVAAGEAVGRYLFYVTVVPLDVPGTFSGRR